MSICAAGCLALALAVGAAAQAPGNQPRAELVHIDAVVTDARGRPVDGLRTEHFEVMEAGTPRPIDSIRFVKADATRASGETLPPIQTKADEQAEASREGSRLFGIFLDEYHVAPEASARVRDLLTRFLDQQLGPRDLVVVLKPLNSLLNLRVSRNRDEIGQAVATFSGRKGEYAPRNRFESDYIAGSPARVEAVRAQVATSALNALAVHLGNLTPARKTIILVSEGFARGQRRRGDESLPTIDAVVRTANRSNVSIYAIDPRALTADPAGLVNVSTGRPSELRDADGSDRDTLSLLAKETDGHAILEPSDVAAGLDRINRDSSAYYVIALRTASRIDAGTFHPVQVRVNVPGALVRARKGYWTSSVDDLWRTRLAEAAALPPLPVAPPRRVSPLIRPWFGVARGGNGLTRVSFVWEPVARVPGDRARTQVPARIALKASKPDGTALFEGVVRPATPGLSRSAGEAAQAVFEMPPGPLRLQMAIEDAQSRVLDTDIREIAVSAVGGRVALGSAHVMRARTAREYRALAASSDPVPVASREFSRAERLLIRFPAYAANGRPEVSARLLSRLGSPMRPLSIDTTSDPAVHQIDLPLAGLAAGEYAIEVTATGEGAQAKETIAFRVTP